MSKATSTMAEASSLRRDLRRLIPSLGQATVEELVRELLLRCGYDSVQRTGRTVWKERQGGVELTASTSTDLERGLTAVQVRVSRKQISRSDVDRLRGIMLRIGARQGLLVTAAMISDVARQTSHCSEIAPIRLIDGNEFIELLIAHRVGIATDEAGTLSVDAGFFDKLRKRYTSTYDSAARSGAGSPRSRYDNAGPTQLSISIHLTPPHHCPSQEVP